MGRTLRVQIKTTLNSGANMQKIRNAWTLLMSILILNSCSTLEPLFRTPLSYSAIEGLLVGTWDLDKDVMIEGTGDGHKLDSSLKTEGQPEFVIEYRTDHTFVLTSNGVEIPNYKNCIWKLVDRGNIELWIYSDLQEKNLLVHSTGKVLFLDRNNFAMISTLDEETRMEITLARRIR